MEAQARNRVAITTGERGNVRVSLTLCQRPALEDGARRFSEVTEDHVDRSQRTHT